MGRSARPPGQGALRLPPLKSGLPSVPSETSSSVLCLSSAGTRLLLATLLLGSLDRVRPHHMPMRGANSHRTPLLNIKNPGLEGRSEKEDGAHHHTITRTSSLYIRHSPGGCASDGGCGCGCCCGLVADLAPRQQCEAEAVNSRARNRYSFPLSAHEARTARTRYAVPVPLGFARLSRHSAVAPAAHRDHIS